MGGRGRRGKPKTNTPAGAGRGSAPPTQVNTAPNSAGSQSSSRVPAESGCSRVRPRDQPLQSRQQQRRQQQPPEQGAIHQREPRTYIGCNGTAKRADRGSVRGRQVLYPDIVVTKSEGVSKKGKSGWVVQLTTNYFRLIKRPDWQIYQYRVDFSPSIENTRFMKKLIHDHRANLGGFLFDGTVLFLCNKLHNDVTEFMAKDDRDESPIQIKVKFVKLVSMLNGESVQVLNLILRGSMAKLNLQLVGRNFYDALARVSIRNHNLELWPGYDTSIRQHETDILMCAQITNKVVRTETVYDIMNKYRQKADFKANVSTALLGMTVLTHYNNRTYRIDDITFDMSPMNEFDTRNGKVSFMEYYRTKHNITIRDRNQPMLITRSKDRSIRGGLPEQILLIPELCRATGLSNEMRNNYWLMEDVATHTRLGPAERITKLMAFNQRLQTTPASVANFKDFDFVLDKQLVQLTGHQLPKESLYFGNNKQLEAEDWAFAFRNSSMYSQQPLRNWVVLVPKIMRKETEDFIGILKRAADGMRYEIKHPTWVEITDDFGSSYAKGIDTALNKDPQLVMCILTSLNSDKYSIIKKKCCVERAIPSQVMVGKTITPKRGKTADSLLSVGTKVVIQINAKLGGAPWMANMATFGIMVVGFDVCHDTNDKSKSYGALVATMDMKKSASYFSAVSPHKNGEELCNSFAFNMSKALICYRQLHGALPDRIFIYRDGVGEGQTEYVREHEIKVIQAQLHKLYNGKPYKLLFVVVSKRINTRFFLNGDNPNPGTVVDDVVTLPERHDFYLIAQKVRHVTVSPTNYNILYNTSGLGSDDIQKFTYKMTYLYYNWTSTLAVPAVCQYAHKLAFLVGNFIHQSPSSSLEKQLYFL